MELIVEDLDATCDTWGVPGEDGLLVALGDRAEYRLRRKPVANNVKLRAPPMPSQIATSALSSAVESKNSTSVSKRVFLASGPHSLHSMLGSMMMRQPRSRACFSRAIRSSR